jgi:hypothetical protein
MSWPGFERLRPGFDPTISFGAGADTRVKPAYNEWENGMMNF